MKFFKFISAITASVLAVPTIALTAYAGNQTTAEMKPVYSEFNENDVNGGIAVILPENLDAKVTITLDSPEENDALYYDSTISSADGQSYVFELEGYDTVLDDDGKPVDGRVYSVTIDAKETLRNIPLESFTDTGIIVPDGDNELNSSVIYGYEIIVETVEEVKDPYTVEVSEDTGFGAKWIVKTITFYVPNQLKGDVNNDGVIDSSDSSSVLSEYALVSTGKDATFNEFERKAADVNEDGAVDSVDASKILKYYAEASTGGNPSWD